MSHDAFAHFIQPGPPRISMCELLVPILGKREMPDLPLPEVFCAFLEPLTFPFCVFQEKGGADREVVKPRFCQGEECDRRSLHKVEAPQGITYLVRLKKS